MIFTLGKANEDSMIEKLNIPRPLRNMIILQLHCIADHIKTTGHNIKWDNFDILQSGKTDYHCKIKETLFIYELKPALSVNVGSEKLLLY